jgi:LPXTG-motif cell wall-anchored protein
MSQPKVVGPAAAAVATATLPVTGFNSVSVVVAGIALVVGGLLLVRAGRFRGNDA